MLPNMHRSADFQFYADFIAVAVGQLCSGDSAYTGPGSTC